MTWDSPSSAARNTEASGALGQSQKSPNNPVLIVVPQCCPNWHLRNANFLPLLPSAHPPAASSFPQPSLSHLDSPPTTSPSQNHDSKRDADMALPARSHPTSHLPCPFTRGQRPALPRRSGRLCRTGPGRENVQIHLLQRCCLCCPRAQKHRAPTALGSVQTCRKTTPGRENFQPKQEQGRTCRGLEQNKAQGQGGGTR